MLLASWTLYPASRDVCSSIYAGNVSCVHSSTCSGSTRSNWMIYLASFDDTSLNSVSTFEDFWTVWMVGAWRPGTAAKPLNLWCHWELHSLLAQMNRRHLSSQQGTTKNAFVDVLDLGENLSIRHCDSTAHPPPGKRTATGAPHSLLDLLDGHLDVRHVVFVRMIKDIGCFLQCTDDLVIIWRSSPS